MFLHRLLYRSDAALLGSGEEIEEQMLALIEKSRAANEAAGLTGALLLSAGVFIQVLEGPISAVEVTFERICGDLRHRRVRLLQLAIIKDRLFDDWSMTRVTPTAELARLCLTLEVSERSRLNSLTAGMVTQAMQALLRTSELPVSPTLVRSEPAARPMPWDQPQRGPTLPDTEVTIS